MKTIQIEITGTTPLLMNNPKSMLLPKKMVVNKTEAMDWNKEAEKVVYRNDKGFLYVPSTAIKGCLLGACSFKKIGKYSAKSIIAGGTKLNKTEIELLDLKGKQLKNYEVDLRTVVIQRKDRVIKARPKISNWKIIFDLLYNEELISDPELIIAILKDAGERVGILDFRPQKSGDFGCFKITKFGNKKQ